MTGDQATVEGNEVDRNDADASTRRIAWLGVGIATLSALITAGGVFVAWNAANDASESNDLNRIEAVRVQANSVIEQMAASVLAGRLDPNSPWVGPVYEQWKDGVDAANNGDTESIAIWTQFIETVREECPWPQPGCPTAVNPDFPSDPFDQVFSGDLESGGS